MSENHHKIGLYTAIAMILTTAVWAGCAQEKNSEEWETDGSWLENWPAEADPATVGQKIAALFAKNVDGEDEDEPHYKHACGWYGALQVAEQLGDQSLLNTLITEFEPYKNAYAEMTSDPSDPGHVDRNVFGIVPLEIGLQNSDSTVLAEGLRLAQHQLANKDATDQKRFAVDDMFMITALQLQAYRATANKAYLNYAADTMVEYLNQLQLADGLFYHLKTNDVKWSRGNGWFASGMTEMLKTLPPRHPRHARIFQGYQDMMAGLLPFQIQEGEDKGMWKQVIDYDGADNWAESSGTAMFTFAMVTGVNRGWLDENEYGYAARNAWLALVGRLKSDGRMTGISNWCYFTKIEAYLTQEGRNKERSNAGALKVVGDNHGQAPLMWTAAALMGR